MLLNAYFVAQFRFDTAENEPAKKFAKFANFAPSKIPVRGPRPEADRPRRGGAPAGRGPLFDRSERSGLTISAKLLNISADLAAPILK